MLAALKSPSCGSHANHFDKFSQPCLVVSPCHLHIFAAISTFQRHYYFDAPIMPL